MAQLNEKKILASELHKPARVYYHRRSFIMKGIDDTWQIDLVEMHKFSNINKGFNYILTAIDVFSKYGFAIPVKNKTGKDVTAAFEKILIDSKRRPKNCQSDFGKEFYNSTFQILMKKYKIHHYSTYSNLKAAICERYNRSLKEIMYRQFTIQGTYKWLHLLPKVVEYYNNRLHRTIGMKPSLVMKKHEKHLLQNIYKEKKIKKPVPKYKIGDSVRVSNQKTVFSKGYTQSWSNEIFKIRKIQLTNPPTYLLNDYQGNPILGGFYETEIQGTKLNDVYFVEKVIKRTGNKLFVKWLGFDDDHNSWIKNTEIIT